ncbi:MAG TPA: hypothetical protein VGX23_16575 [Actinocrinis sp.]|nr:hypothetical protein [Actinocrinis sp.]
MRPLLPGTPGCQVLATSRRRLIGLDDTHSLSLDVLSQAEALALLHKVAQDGRIRDDDPSAADLLALCGYLPLAVRLAAARLRRRTNLPVRDLVADLRDEAIRLARLQDEDWDLTAVFDSSYAALPLAERRLFRYLGMLLAPDVDAQTAAYPTDADPHTAEHLLDSLLDHNLLTQSVPGRYRFHELTRVYARGLTHLDAADSAPGSDQA